MAVVVQAGSEPIPGYRLIERLGGGGFGEVWKCEAPGGLLKAIKFVYGDLESNDEEGARAEQEHKSLARIQNVRHPYILSLERYDIIDGQLLIVMELADHTLWDRFKECRAQGLVGVPRDELLSYMRETAEALDLMITEYQLQHLDIKPQNLFLVHHHVKVADFGLVKVMEKKMVTVTGGVTPVYAAPETFDGYVSRFSDQYSLAIVYQELLTGKRPFDGGSMRQLILQHLQAKPNLDALSEHDRAPVGRALEKSPDGRFPSCKDFVDALSGGAASSAPAPAPSPRTRREELPEVPYLPEEHADSDDQKTHGGTGPRLSNQSLGSLEPPPLSAPMPPPVTVDDNGETSQRFTAASAVRLSNVPPSTSQSAVSSFQRLPAGQSSPTLAGGGRKAVADVQGDGILVPSLVVGLGFMGMCALKQLRQEINQQFGSSDLLPNLRLLCLDTDPEALALASRGDSDAALRQGEVQVARLHRPSHYLKSRLGKDGLDALLPPKMLYRMTRQQTASGVRALGRLALVDNYPSIVRRLEAELRACNIPEALQAAAESTGLGIRNTLPRVYVVTSLSGGTGSGMFIDIAYLLRHLLKKIGADRAEIVGLFLSPPVDEDQRKTPAIANAYAALRELHHFGNANSAFKAIYDSGESNGGGKLFTENGPAFQRALLLPLTDHVAEPPSPAEGADCLTSLTPASRQVVALAGHYLLTDLLSPLGRAADAARKQIKPTKNGRSRSSGDGLNLQTLGMFRFLWPRRQLLARAAHSLCRGLVRRWMTKDAKPLREPLKDWVRQQWDECGLGQDALIGRLHQASGQTLKQSPENYCATVLGPLIELVGPKPKGKDTKQATAAQIGAVVEALDQLEKVLGVPEEGKSIYPGRPTIPPGSLEQELQDFVQCEIGDYEQRIAELIVRLIEAPDYRLAGAEEAIRQLNHLTEQALETHEQLAKELQERSVAIYKRLHKIIEMPMANNGPPNSSWKTPFTRHVNPASSPLATELVELLRTYSKCRYQSLVLHSVNLLFVALRGLLSDQLREVDFCRARLSDLCNLLADPPWIASAVNAPVAGRCLFPEGCASLEEAAKQLEGRMTPEKHREIDHRMQAMLTKQFQALVQVCTSSANTVKTLAPVMVHEAETFLGEQLGPADIAEMYLNQHEIRSIRNGNPVYPLKEDLLASFAKAAPPVKGSKRSAELCLLAIPPGEAEKELRQRVDDALPDAKLLPAASIDEILIYREQNHVPLSELPQIGPTAEAAYRKACAQVNFTPHSRIDVTEWSTAGSRRG